MSSEPMEPEVPVASESDVSLHSASVAVGLAVDDADRFVGDPDLDMDLVLDDVAVIVADTVTVTGCACGRQGSVTPPAAAIAKGTFDCPDPLAPQQATPPPADRAHV
jgi:hypothetical protein